MGEEKGMGFGEALEYARKGAKVHRSGWNAQKLGIKGFVVYQKGYLDGIAINDNTAETTGLPAGTVMAFSPYLMLCFPVERLTHESPAYRCHPWTPDQKDLLAEDWVAELKD